MANPRGQQRDKPYRDALRIEAKLAETGQPSPAPKGSLRWIARQQLEAAGEDTGAAREVADRLDGKVPQAIVGDDESPPIRTENSDVKDRLAHFIGREAAASEPAEGTVTTH